MVLLERALIRRGKPFAVGARTLGSSFYDVAYAVDMSRGRNVGHDEPPGELSANWVLETFCATPHRVSPKPETYGTFVARANREITLQCTIGAGENFFSKGKTHATWRVRWLAARKKPALVRRFLWEGTGLKRFPVFRAGGL
jgi:hypothetical protein